MPIITKLQGQFILPKISLSLSRFSVHFYDLISIGIIAAQFTTYKIASNLKIIPALKILINLLM